MNFFSFNQNRAGKHPSASDGAINLMTSLVTEVHGSKIKKAFEFFQVGSFDLLTFFFKTSWVITGRLEVHQDLQLRQETFLFPFCSGVPLHRVGSVLLDE